MKTLAVEVPDQLASQMQDLVEAGWFMDQGELTRQALMHFVQRSRFQLQEKFQRDDIRWALTLKDAEK